jgi:hypothetical protein
MAQLQLNLRLDYPVKQVLSNLSGDKTVADLKSFLSSELDLDKNYADKYNYFSIEYGKDLIDLSAVNNSTVLSAVPINNRSTILAVAPAELKPAYSKTKLVPNKEEVKEEKKEQKEVDKYAGLTHNNIFTKLSETTNATKRKILLEYVEIYASKIFPNPKALEWDEATVNNLVQSNELNADEATVLDFLQKYTTAKNISIKPFLSYVRFPIMSTQDIATKVAPFNLLEQQEILDLFTYLGMKQAAGDNAEALKATKVPDSLKKFSAEKRKGRKPTNWFKFDQTKKHASLTLSEEGTVVSCATSTNYQPIFGDIELDKGQHEWNITLTQFYVNSYSVCIGVVPVSFTNYTVAQMVGYSGHIPGWSYAVGHGYKYSQAGNLAYGKKCAQGDVIKVKLDLDAGTLEFFVNEISQGVAYTGITVPVRPALSLYGINSVKLTF